MIRKLLAIAVVWGCVVSAGGRAAVISRDWKTPGDGLLTFDDVNQREWLDLSQTLLVQFPGGTREDKYQAVVNELNPGGSFHGFVVANGTDVTQLAGSSGIDVSTLNFATNSGAVLSLGQLLGFTAEFLTGSRFAVGMLDEFSSPPFVDRLGAIFLHDVVSGPSGQAGLRVTSQSDALASATAGVMLFRQVPEPGACTVAIFLFHDLLRARRMRRYGRLSE